MQRSLLQPVLLGEGDIKWYFESGPRIVAATRRWRRFGARRSTQRGGRTEGWDIGEATAVARGGRGRMNSGKKSSSTLQGRRLDLFTYHAHTARRTTLEGEFRGYARVQVTAAHKLRAAGYRLSP